MSNTTFPNICIIGAGVSGICAAVQLIRKLELGSFTMFDENEEVGGTWLKNSYPGCACDVQSHLYSYSFEPNPYWSHNFASREEIFGYMRNIALKYDLYPKIKFQTQVKSLVWKEEIKKWSVTVRHSTNNNQENYEQTYEFDIVINGTGGLRIPKYPEEFMSFKGPIIHSAKWDSTVELEDKVIAVIGSGASAIQIIPTIADQVKNLHVYQRKPAWITPRSQFKIPEVLKFIFAYVPFAMLLYRFFIYAVCDFEHRAFVVNSIIRKMGEIILHLYLRFQIRQKQVLEDLTPDYGLGCKRIGVSEVYYNAFNKPNVKLHRNQIKKVTNNFIVTENGDKQKIDALILATGFHTQDYFAPMKLIGKQDENILQKWKNFSPSAYCGVITHAAPNHFIVLGPNTILGQNSVVFMAECQVNFIISVIRHMQKTGSQCVTVNPTAEKEYMDTLRKNMSATIWANDACDSWYTNSKGDVTSLWPQASCIYWWKLSNVDISKFQFS